MLSYHNDPAVKIKYQQRFEAHRRAEEVIQGTGFYNGRGCFVGCTLDAYDHNRFPEELGWPIWLAYLADTIFEGLPKEEAPQFGTDLLEAVPVGKDLEPVRWKLAALRHRNQLETLKDNDNGYAEEVRNALLQVISYCEAETKTEEARATAVNAAEAAARTAWAAWWDAADAADAAPAAWAADAAARTAWQSAAEAQAQSAGTAAKSWAAQAAWSAQAAAEAEAEAYRWERDTLLDLLRNM